jgi:hypothetical protein
MEYNWHGIGSHASRSYTCGYCGNPLASEKAYYAQRTGSNKRGVY